MLVLFAFPALLAVAGSQASLSAVHDTLRWPLQDAVSRAVAAAPRVAPERPLVARSWVENLAIDLARLGVRAQSEYYLLREPLEASFTRDEQQAALIAVVALRRLERPGEALFEREVTFRQGGLRIRHTESCIGDTRRLVWREFLPTRSRTWIADWDRFAARGRTIGYGWNRPTHEALDDAPSGTARLMGPLELLHGARTGAFTAGMEVGLVDPSAAAVVDARVSTGDTGLTVRRTDESLVFDTVMAGAPDLEGLRWAAGTARLARIDADEYRRHLGRWAVESRRPYDAVLARIPDRR